MTRSDKARLAQAQRKTRAGTPKKMEVCSHCGLMLGVRERRLHGERSKGKSLGVQKMDEKKSK